MGVDVRVTEKEKINSWRVGGKEREIHGRKEVNRERDREVEDGYICVQCVQHCATIACCVEAKY